jgi:hypothetical protein
MLYLLLNITYGVEFKNPHIRDGLSAFFIQEQLTSTFIFFAALLFCASMV